MRKMSTNAASGLDVRLSSAASLRRKLALATLARHDGVPVRADPHGHNALMTQTTDGGPGRTRAAWLAALLLGNGVLHFAIPKPYDFIVPAELPGSARFYTQASGAAELVTGALLLTPRTRRPAGLAAAALFVAVFPANVNMVRLWWDKPWPMRLLAIARLPLQIPMITHALKVWRSPS
jgi:uncharacterized membrane protein